MNTKTIARATGRSTAEINSIARHRGLTMSYRHDLRHWNIDSEREGRKLLEELRQQ